MSRWLGGFLAALMITQANAGKIQISKKNALIFDLPVKQGQTVPVWIPKAGEPYTTELEALAHDGFVFDTLLDAESRIQYNIEIARTTDARNAFAFRYQDSRFVAFDPRWAETWRGTAGFSWTLAHEIGHHVCGHQDDVANANPWSMELEADRFAGHLMRLVEARGPSLSYTTFADVMAALPRILSANASATHPAREMRIVAVLQGYNNGSPCADRLPRPPGPWRYLTDDGSAILFKKSRNTWSATYEVPAANLQGVKPESLFFEGTKVGHRLEGTARSYTEDACMNFSDYKAVGSESEDGREIVLTGQLNVRNKQCEGIAKVTRRVTLRRVD